MRITLTEYQAVAVDKVLKRILSSQAAYENEEYSAVVLSAVTGAGKTVIATAVIEQLLEGGDVIAAPHPDTTLLWVTSDPTLNAQTLQKMESASDRLGNLGRFRTVTAGQSINQEVFDPGTVTFLNTQAARRGSVIDKRTDSQQFSIWDTIANSVVKYGSNFIVFIDEAHRGVEQKPDKDQSTIVNRLVNGPKPVPVVVGISATADKFHKSIATAIAGEPRTPRNVTVPVSDVQASGIIKDRIVLHNPVASAAGTFAADTTLIRAGVKQSLAAESSWALYCSAEGENLVLPALVVQLQDKPTDDALREVVDAVLDEWPGLSVRNIVNTFAEHQHLDLGAGRVIKYMQPHHIQDQTYVRVILAKNAITTGWDCPRAEVLVSLRTAKDHTYIAQLIGRTIRQPLARRIEADETLNKVHCYLPRFDVTGVNAVIEQFRNEGDDSLPVDIVRATLTYGKADGTDAAFQLLGALPSYQIPSRLRAPGTRRLHRLAAELAHDNIDPEAPDEAKRLLNIEMDAIAARLETDVMNRRAEIEHVKLHENEVSTTGDLISSGAALMPLKRDRNNIDDTFRTASRALKDGLAEDYWNYLVDKDPTDVVAHKVTVAALGTLQTAVNDVQTYANLVTSTWLKKHGKAVSELSEGRRGVYDTIRSEAKDPELSTVATPDVVDENLRVAPEQAENEAAAIAFARSDSGHRFPQHLYVDDDGMYYAAALNKLERDVLAAEISDGDLWYRNPPAGRRSLTIPYQLAIGQHAGLHPDFLVFREVDGQMTVSIIDPHGTHFDDSDPKLRGLIQYAELHGGAYRSILAVDRIGVEVLALPLHVAKIRERVLKRLDAGESSGHVFSAEGVPL
ncbi:DEAD/DEAH box helicase [Agromyces ramosus]|uniref:Type III restriction enzyme n=1 Tax=Agromyces ramosus TaxID=33879 RepID=A0ABU0R5Y5_9MICO|nr:DEAD/DEAH box helicase family protein [Agromyces ramosus]MDQ0893495.1 type III restriction enzyme [Agromyces ramosus]